MIYNKTHILKFIDMHVTCTWLFASIVTRSECLVLCVQGWIQRLNVSYELSSPLSDALLPCLISRCEEHDLTELRALSDLTLHRDQTLHSDQLPNSLIKAKSLKADNEVLMQITLAQKSSLWMYKGNRYTLAEKNI